MDRPTMGQARSQGRIARVLVSPSIERKPDVTTEGAGIALGTRVATLDGMLPVEFLTPGDRVVTRAGAMELRAVTVQATSGRFVRIARGVLGQNRPAGDLVLGAATALLLRGWRAEALHGAAEVLVPASTLIDGRHVSLMQGAAQRLFALHFDGDAVIYADGVEIGTRPISA